jgi:hypothetical protein
MSTVWTYPGKMGICRRQLFTAIESTTRAANNLQAAFYNVESFATWQTTSASVARFRSASAHYLRPISRLGQSTSFRVRPRAFITGVTVSPQKRMSRGVYFRLAYTWAHAIDSVQDAAAGSPATILNPDSTKSERVSSATG